MQQDITLLSPPLTVQPKPKTVPLPAPASDYFSGRIDLHGMTEAQAHAALQAAIAHAVRLKKKRLVVITGKGSRGEGALKRNVPRWLELTPQVTGCKTASPREGGEGAWVVTLKVRP
jgi:DNA-nicking Smr family endonuclease